MAKAHTLADNFDDGATDGARWTVDASPPSAAGRVREADGCLVIRPAAYAVGFGGYSSAAAYDLAESEVFVEVLRALAHVPGCELVLMARTDGGSAIGMGIWDGSLHAFSTIAGAAAYPAEVAYDPREHRWLRIRERRGFTYWETSPDGCAWNTLARAADPISPASVRIILRAGTRLPAPEPGMAVLDNFNVRHTWFSRRVNERPFSARIGWAGAHG